jgi:bacterial/archaeal transporter family protein
MHEMWVIFALGSAFFAGLTAIFGKCGVSQINSNLATLIRTIVILVVTAAVITWRREWEPLNKLSRSNVLFLCLSGVATGLSWLCYYRALQLGAVSEVAPVDKLGLAFVILLAWWFLDEPMTWRVIAGGSLVIAGAVTLATK